MLIIALVLALIGLIALVFAVVTSNELVAWVCIGASVLGVVLLIVDALRERQRIDAANDADREGGDSGDDEAAYVDYPDEAPAEVPAGGDQDHDTVSEESAESSLEADIETGEESAVTADGHGDDRAT